MRDYLDKEVWHWHVANGGHFKRPANHALRLLREVVELCVATGASPDEIGFATCAEIDKAVMRNEIGGNPAAVPQEWADCAMLLEVFSKHWRIDEYKEIRQKLDILLERKWQADAGGALYRPPA